MRIQNQLTVYAAFIAVFISYMVFVPYTLFAASSLQIHGQLEPTSRLHATLRVRLALYTDQKTTASSWTETYDGTGRCAPVSVQKNGSYQLTPGSCVPLSESLLSKSGWLQISVRDGTRWKASGRLYLSASNLDKSQLILEDAKTAPTLQEQIRSGALKVKSGGSLPQTSTQRIIAMQSSTQDLTVRKDIPFSLQLSSSIARGTVTLLRAVDSQSFIIGSMDDLIQQLSGTVEPYSGLSPVVLLGTDNQVAVSQSGQRYTLSLPQNVHTGATFNVAGLKITGLGGVLKAADGTVSGSAGVADLAGVDISDPTNGQLLRYNGSDEEWQNWTPDVVSLTGLSATSPLTYNSSSGAFGLSYNSTNLTVSSNSLNTIQNIGTSSNPTFAGLNSSGRILLTTTGDSGSLSSSGGAMHINLTNDIGSGIGIYSNAGASAQGNMINVKVDNSAYAQAAFYMNYDGSSNAVEIVSNSSDTSSNALAVTGNNPNDSTLGIIGYETGRGTIKITHNGTGTDANASAISIDLAGTGTRAQGLYVDSTASSGTLGNLLRLRNQTVDKFVVNYQGNLDMAGSLSIGANGTDTTFSKTGNTAGDEFFVGTNGAFRVQRSATNSEAFRVQINGDTQGRWLGTSDGKMKWGDGSSTQDTVLQRGAAGILWLDGGLVINNGNGNYNTTIKGVTDSNLFFVSSTGNSIGIGTSTQGSKLDIADSGTGVVHALRLQNTVAAANNSASDILFAAKRLTSGTTNIASISGMITDVTQSAFKGALLFSTANNSGPAERMRIDNTGNVGINTNNPQFFLQVRIDGSNEGHVTSTGAWANTSDLRFKKNIDDFSDGLSKVMALRPVTYDTLSAPENPGTGLHMGFIAQEVEKIAPQLVDTDGNGFKSLTYGQFAPLLVSAIQQQQLTLDTAGQRLAGLEAQSPTVLGVDERFDQYSTRLDALELQLTNLKTLFDSQPKTENTTLSDSTVKNLIAKQALTVEGSSLFKGSAEFKSPVTLNTNAGGYAKIKTGARKVQIRFESPYAVMPVIYVTPKNTGVSYELSDESEKGFTIQLAEPATKELSFSWLAFTIKDPKTYESTDSDTAPTVTTSPTPEVTVIEPPSPTVTPTL